MAEEIENESLDTPDLKGISTVTGEETAESLDPIDPVIQENTTITPADTPDGNGDDDKKKKKKNQL